MVASIQQIFLACMAVVLSQAGTVLSFHLPAGATHHHHNLRHESRYFHQRGSSRSSSSSTTSLQMEVLEYDVAIIGGGPAGCTCALYTSRADLKTIILDKNPNSGALAITSHIANYPGVDRSMS